MGCCALLAYLFFRESLPAIFAVFIRCKRCDWALSPPNALPVLRLAEAQPAVCFVAARLSVGFANAVRYNRLMERTEHRSRTRRPPIWFLITGILLMPAAWYFWQLGQHWGAIYFCLWLVAMMGFSVWLMVRERRATNR